MAGINSTVFITQYSGHSTDILYTCSLDNVDAIVCIGGDGTFSEIFNGLVVRTAKDAAIDYNDCEVILPTPSIPIGVVPGGSTDTMAYCFHGTSDIETAVLLIILGNLFFLLYVRINSFRVQELKMHMPCPFDRQD